MPTGLAEATQYDVYVLARDDNGDLGGGQSDNVQASVGSFALTTADVTPPAFESTFPSIPSASITTSARSPLPQRGTDRHGSTRIDAPPRTMIRHARGRGRGRGRGRLEQVSAPSVYDEGTTCSAHPRRASLWVGEPSLAAACGGRLKSLPVPAGGPCRRKAGRVR